MAPLEIRHRSVRPISAKHAQASRFLQQSPASVALHHKLCHTLGGTFDMPHAQTHTAVLPHAIAYNAPSVPEAMERASRALGGGDLATKLYELAVVRGAELSLAQPGMPKDGIAKTAALAVANPFPPPPPFHTEEI